MYTRGRKRVVIVPLRLDLPLGEIAGVLGLPISTVTHLRAKDELQVVLEGRACRLSGAAAPRRVRRFGTGRRRAPCSTPCRYAASQEACAHRRSRRSDSRGAMGIGHGQNPHRADGHSCSSRRCSDPARMVRPSVTSASSPGSADGRGGRQCPLRCRRRRARTRRAFGLAVLHPPAAAAARNRDRLDDGSGHGAARRSDSHEHDVSRGRASSPAPRRRDLSAMGGPGAARSAARAVPAARTDSTPQRRRGGVHSVAAVEVRSTRHS